MSPMPGEEGDGNDQKDRGRQNDDPLTVTNNRR